VNDLGTVMSDTRKAITARRGRVRAARLASTSDGPLAESAFILTAEGLARFTNQSDVLQTRGSVHQPSEPVRFTRIQLEKENEIPAMNQELLNVYCYRRVEGTDNVGPLFDSI
jgi:hypothetical protein